MQKGRKPSKGTLWVRSKLQQDPQLTGKELMKQAKIAKVRIKYHQISNSLYKRQPRKVGIKELGTEKQLFKLVAELGLVKSREVLKKFESLVVG